MHQRTRPIVIFAALGAALSLDACAVVPPSGPTVMALPVKGENLQAFRQDDGECRDYAARDISYQQPGQAGTNAAVGSAAIGTAAGAAAGAALGAVGGNAGAGAAIGGAAGLIGGSAVGAGNAAASEGDLQQRYDIAYTQCMYAHGNTVASLPFAYGYGTGAALSYDYPPFGYPYPYPYPYGLGFYSDGLGFTPGIAFGFGHRHFGFHHGEFHHSGFHHSGFSHSGGGGHFGRR